MKKKAKELFSQYWLQSMGVEPDTDLEVSYVDAAQFLTANRIDLIAKLIYIDSKVNHHNVDFAKKLYAEHIDAFSNGTFVESDKKDVKNSLEMYFKVFDELIEQIPKEGFSAEKSVVPVGEDGNIIDGSHRTSIAIYFHLPLPIVRIPGVKTNYDYILFRSQGLHDFYLDHMALQFLYRAESCHLAILYPIANSKEKNQIAEQYLRNAGTICYKKEVKLNLRGLEMLLIHAYGHHDWAGTDENGFSGIRSNAYTYYDKGEKATVYLLSGATLDQCLSAKEAVRQLYHIGNQAIHITDTKDEAILLGQMLFNQNSIHFLNRGKPFKYPSFIKNFKAYRSALRLANCSPEDYAIESSSVLAAYGLREANDIDYLTLGEDRLPKSEIYDFHVLENHPTPIDQLIYDPFCHFYYRGIKFVTLEQVKRFKQSRNEEKDIMDVQLIQRSLSSYLSAGSEVKLALYKQKVRLRRVLRKAVAFSATSLRRFPRLYLKIRTLYRSAKKLIHK